MAATKTIKKIICTKCKYEISSQNIKRHLIFCDGNGPRKNRKGKGQDWLKGKTYIEIYGEVRATEIKTKQSTSTRNSDSFITLGRAKSDKEEEIRKLKISNSMMNNTNWKNSIHKSGRGKRGYYKGYYFMSSWELAYIVYCLEHDINIKRNLESFEYTYENKTKRYFPDFIVEGQFVEIKGYSNEQFEAKKSQFPHPLKIIDKHNIGPILEYVIDKYGANFVDLLKA